MRNDLPELQKRQAELRRLIRWSGLTCAPLESDLTHAVKQWQKDKSQFWGRTVFRCLCAAIEARLFTFRTMATELAQLSRVQFDPKEVEILTEQRIIVTNGVKTMRPKFLPIPDSVKESLRLFGKSLGATVSADCSAPGFQDFCRVFEVRNRLMHPKQPFDVQITQTETEIADRGIAWFNGAYTDVLDQCREHMRKTIAAQSRE